MTAYLSKMWHMKKVKEIANKNNIEGLRYVKTLTFEKDESIMQYSYSNVLLEIGHPGDGFSLCLRMKGFLICRGDARLAYETDLGYWINCTYRLWKTHNLKEGPTTLP